ncbi:hypothetical protein [Pseudomonas sp.]|jgi:hypothetical protein|uniref:hypothetical protein n=1 Tax=Pseudomonas sp. TaxID=306 RepID=UPI002ED8BAC5
MSLFDSVSSSITGGSDIVAAEIQSSGSTSIISTALGSVADSGTLAGTAVGLLGGVLAASSAASSWGKMSTYLIAQLYACDADGKQLDSEPNFVMGPITDATFEASLNWQSPFENAGPESKAPALMALLQSGQAATVVNALQAAFPSLASNSTSASAAETAKNVAKDLEGRTGITKLNSRQVFSGMPPIKIPITLHFRAMLDPETEIMVPYRRLLSWLLPQNLAKDGILTEVIASSGSSAANMVKAMFPSTAPLMVGLKYGINNYYPLVIESISHPLDGPIDSSGKWIYRAVQLTLSTLTALDRNDVPKMFI